MDDVRVGRFIRASRRRLGWRQVDLAARAGVSQQEISLLERGHLDAVPLRILRAVLRALDASVELDVRWRGGAIDRLLDERHAALVSATCRVLGNDGWDFLTEVSYSVYGERGSIDVLGWKREKGAAVAVEVKSELTSLEQTLRKHDEKVRLAGRVVRDRDGWMPTVVGRLLVLPDTSTSRRRLDRAGPAFSASYPMRPRAMRDWLRTPGAPAAGVLLLSGTIPSSAGRRLVRSPAARAARAAVAAVSGTAGGGR